MPFEDRRDAPVVICAPAEHSSRVGSHEAAACTSCDLDDANPSQCGNLEEPIREIGGVIDVNKVLGYSK